MSEAIIKLTPGEALLFDLIRKAIKFSCAKINHSLSFVGSDNPSLASVTPRVVGGWVRDKLLGLDSDDLDIALDKMSGEQFATCFNEFLHQQGFITHGFGIIQSNPSKSKHLETATLTVDISGDKLIGATKFKIDFVHLRAESYENHSRIPSQVTFGNPKDDAFRRDLTFNALFYNLVTEKIEDFTEFGLYDLKNKIARTPLPPFQTFLDDPLRILRVARFAARFGCKLAPISAASAAAEAFGNKNLATSIIENICQVVNMPQIKTAFTSKLSRERIGIELVKMLNGPDPYTALRINFEDFNYYENILWIPPTFSIENPIVDNSCFYKVFSPSTSFTSLQRSVLNSNLEYFSLKFLELSKIANDLLLRHGWIKIIDPEPKLLWLSLCLFPCRTYQIQEHFNIDSSLSPDIKNRLEKRMTLSQNPLSSFFILESLKLPASIAKDINKILKYSDDFGTIFSEYINNNCTITRLSVGKIIYDCGLHWKICLFLSALVQPWHLHVTFFEFINYIIQELELESVYNLKPLIDGNLLCKLLQKKPGKWLTECQRAQIEWQLQNPTGSSSEMVAFLKSISLQ